MTVELAPRASAWWPSDRHHPFPFQIAVPTDAAPCWDAKYNSQHWYLQVVADLPMMRDEVTRIELLVNPGTESAR